jgi:hypothetical protein
VIGDFQLTGPAYHISNIIIILYFDYPSFGHSAGETPPDRGGFECALQSSEQSEFINSDKSGDMWFSLEIQILIHFQIRISKTLHSLNLLFTLN